MHLQLAGFRPNSSFLARSGSKHGRRYSVIPYPGALPRAEFYTAFSRWKRNFSTSENSEIRDSEIAAPNSPGIFLTNPAGACVQPPGWAALNAPLKITPVPQAPFGGWGVGGGG